MPKAPRVKTQALAIALGDEPQPLTYRSAQHFGRPTSLTTDIITALADLLSEGHYQSTVYEALGVPKRTYYHWRERGERDDEADVQSLEREFWHALKRAEAWGEISLIRESSTGKLGWQGPMTVASRRFREHWQDKTEYTGPGVTINIGARDSDVSVQVIAVSSDTHALSPSVSHDFHRLSDEPKLLSVP